ncbi:hypothetical protein ACIQGT_36440 [Streptomyces sp. NPDC093108]|uniref:hypothetical protein n=1 Tax=Streptomyces sp. NPDC093108 TaxID=3366030 RepID=UPI003820FF55
MGLAAHVRGGGCDDACQAVPEPAEGRDTLAAEEPPETDAPEEGQRRRARAPRTRGEDTAPVGAGPAQGLLLPGPDDEVWKAVPLYLSQNLRMLAHRLVTPEQAVLRERGNHHVRYALRAAGSKRMTGRHWLVLLAAPRESFGSARSERADRVFAVLQQVVAEYVRPAVQEAPGATEKAPAG